MKNLDDIFEMLSEKSTTNEEGQNRGYKERLNIQKKEISNQELKSYIPNSLYHEDFEAKKIESNVIEENKLTYLHSYTKGLEGFLSTLDMRKKPLRSYIVVAPSNYGKKFFAYNCIKTCLEHGLNPSSLLLLNDIEEMYAKKEFSNIKELIIAKDILFLSLGNGVDKKSMDVLGLLLEYAEIYATPLVILSKFPVSYLALYEPNILDNVGLVQTGRKRYGQLKRIGFPDEVMKEFFMNNIDKLQEKKSNQPRPQESYLELNDNDYGIKLEDDVDFEDFEEYKNNLKGDK